MRLFLAQTLILLLIFSAGCQKPSRNELGIPSTKINPVSKEESELAFFTQCQFTDGLEIVGLDRLEPRPKTRSVETVEGTKRILVLDGFRLLFAYPNTRYFANLKVEKLESAGYAADKQAAIENLKFIHWQARNPDREIINRNFKEFDLYGLDNPVIEVDGPIGMYLLFNDAKQIIITIYFLNQDANFRKFQSYHEYEQLRDRFIDEYINCAGATAQPN